MCFQHCGSGSVTRRAATENKKGVNKMKFTAFLMALLLVFSLAACTPEDNNGTNDNNNSNLDGDSSDANGSNNGQNGANNNTPNTPGGNGNTNGGTNGNSAGNGNTDGTPDFGEDYEGDRRFYYAGRLYQITNETVDPDEVGAELFSITDIVEDDPAAEGEGFGLDMDTDIYKFKEENEYDELIVKIGERYYKATVRDDDLIPNPNEGGNTSNGGSGGGNSSNGGNNANGGATGGTTGGTN
jgi:hypothetical protein